MDEDGDAHRMRKHKRKHKDGKKKRRKMRLDPEDMDILDGEELVRRITIAYVVETSEGQQEPACELGPG